MRVNVDFSKIDQDRLVSEGIHAFEVTKCALEPAKSNPAKTVMNVELNITDEADSAGNPKKVWHTFSQEPQALWVMRQFANACGIYPDENGFDTEQLLGRKGRAQILQEKGEGAYAGKVKCTCQEFLPLA